MDKYKNFSQLQESETEGVDYAIAIRTAKGSRVAVIAPHGGGIEPRTAELAEAIASNEFNLYCFRGLKKDRNCELHITSHNFDEPRCLVLLKYQDTVVALHGCDSSGELVLLGGRDKPLIADLAAAINAAGIKAETEGHQFTGLGATNVVNRGATGAGAQIELSMQIRKGLNSAKFVEAVREVLRRHQNAA